MRNLLHITLALFYWVSAVGTHVRLHWCGGEFENISFFHENNQEPCEHHHNEKSCCTKDSKPIEKTCCEKQKSNDKKPTCSTNLDKKSCCEDVHIKAEIKDEHRASQEKFSFSYCLVPVSFQLPEPSIVCEVIQSETEHRPVFTNGPPLYLRFKQLRIGNIELA